MDVFPLQFIKMLLYSQGGLPDKITADVKACPT